MQLVLDVAHHDLLLARRGASRQCLNTEIAPSRFGMRKPDWCNLLLFLCLKILEDLEGTLEL